MALGSRRERITGSVLLPKTTFVLEIETVVTSDLCMSH